MKLDTQDTLKNPMNIGMLGARTYANHYRRNNKHHQNIQQPNQKSSQQN